VGGLVKNLNIAEGQHVRDGGLMVELDDRIEYYSGIIRKS
jgi:multidrug efflux pump subunit AcrA (membrane-fusion protein)